MKHTLPGQMDLPECPEQCPAQRKADQPLRPSQPQVPCDHGLFSDDAAQLDLVDEARRDRSAKRYADKLARSKSARWAAK